MIQIGNEKENGQLQTRQERHVEIFFTGKTGFFGKVFVLVTFVVLLPIAFFFSVLLFSVLFTLALMSMGYAWWVWYTMKPGSGPPTRRKSSPSSKSM